MLRLVILFLYPSGFLIPSANESQRFPDWRLTITADDRKGIAHRVAKRKALDIIEGKIIAGSVAQLIERFRDEIAPTHYLDQSKDGLAVRESGYKNLTKFFGKMDPKLLRMLHGYQYLDARAKAGAPAKANKELSLMSTIGKYAVR